MKVGDLVAPTKESGEVIHCATSIYKEAVAVSIEPFQLVSVSSDMLWNCLSIEDFEVIGSVDKDVLDNCLRRIL